MRINPSTEKKQSKEETKNKVDAVTRLAAIGLSLAIITYLFFKMIMPVKV